MPTSSVFVSTSGAYDNSFATDHPKDEMRFGKGGVDDAEDAEVILHELGHQIHFSQSATFFASNEAGSISEGFGDYWAGDVSEIVAGVQPDPKCIAEWDSVSYTAGPVHCLRRLDSTRMYPTDLNGEVHHDGTIWSHALWNLRTAIGANHADTAILWAQFNWTGTNDAGSGQPHRDPGHNPLWSSAGRGRTRGVRRPRHPLGGSPAAGSRRPPEIKAQISRSSRSCSWRATSARVMMPATRSPSNTGSWSRSLSSSSSTASITRVSTVTG